MKDATIRAWWAARQGLDGTLEGKSAAAVLGRSGWARSVGGSGPYLTLYARGRLGREGVDESVARLEIHELPAARGCTYVVPASDFALALKVGETFDGDMKTARKLGVTDGEIEKLGDAVTDALKQGPLGPDEIRAATGGASRSLGDEGKKRGVSTTLPLALGQLQAKGRIRRIPVNGRLDQQRYQYTLWKPNPLAKFSLTLEEAYTELARRYFEWTGPATLAQFQWFSGLGVKASKAAIEPLGLVPIEDGDERLLLPERLDELRAFQPPSRPSYALVSSVDAIVLLRRDLQGLLEAADRSRKSFDEKGGAALGSLTDLSNHAVLDRGRLVGLWEYSPEEERIVLSAFGTPDKALHEAVARTEAYIRDDLGDARSFSLDSPKSRTARIAALRASAG
jgi:hypothetical protein